MASRICPCRGCTEHTGSCPTITKGGRCLPCGTALNHARGTRQQRGYTTDHDTERRRWARILKAKGQLDCANPSCQLPGQPIRHGDPWDLGHTPDRTSWRGPEHPLCNRSEGGRAAHGGGG